MRLVWAAWFTLWLTIIVVVAVHEVTIAQISRVIVPPAEGQTLPLATWGPGGP